MSLALAITLFAQIAGNSQSVIPPKIQTVATAPRMSLPLTQSGDTQESSFFSTAGNWQIRIDHSVNQTCYSYSVFEGGTIIRVTGNIDDRNVVFMLANSHWPTAYDSTTLAVEFSFSNHLRWDSRATPINFAQTYWLRVPVDQVFIYDFENSEVFYLYGENNELGGYYLSAMQSMLSELNRCQFEVRERQSSHQ